VCDDEKLNEKGLDGSPDLVIEILSKSTARRDRVIKYNEYLEAGVKEYWIVDPTREEVVVNLLKSGKYVARTYGKGDVIKVSVLDDLYINVADLFEGYKGDEIEEVEAAREEERVKAEAGKLDIAKRLLAMGLSIEDVSKGADLDYDIVCELELSVKEV